MRVQILQEARDDLAAGRDFYDARRPGVGDYFAMALATDIAAIGLTPGIHPIVSGFHRALSRRFPAGIFYLIEDASVRVYAVLDLRRDPAWILRQLHRGED